MTTPKPPDALTALSALSLAFDIVKTPCSAAEAQRAEVLLGIAREIREEQQYRDTRSALTSFAGIDNRRAQTSAPLPDDFAATRVRDAYSFGRQTESGPVEPLAVEHPTAYMPALAERTQSLPIVWSVGDKADCRHCHTPIEFVEATIQQQTYAQEHEGLIWRHKYTQQVVCATAPLGGEDEEIVHTFATPRV